MRYNINEVSNSKKCEFMKKDTMPIIRTVAMPSDTNPNGDIFGGWLLSQMDIAGSILAQAEAQGRDATIAINAMKFISPVKVGDTVTCYGVIEKTGNTSITVRLRVTSELPGTRKIKEVTNGIFVYVAIDKEGNPKQLPHK